MNSLLQEAEEYVHKWYEARKAVNDAGRINGPSDIAAEDLPDFRSTADELPAVGKFHPLGDRGRWCVVAQACARSAHKAALVGRLDLHSTASATKPCRAGSLRC